MCIGHKAGYYTQDKLLLFFNFVEVKEIKLKKMKAMLALVMTFAIAVTLAIPTFAVGKAMAKSGGGQNLYNFC